ncbi:MAG TPA: hypothetical protein VK478_11235, partial [Gemmatimonadaceae bacterium]|nr:hypothetical protein [Gemmatimonadaceae bacterium]
MQGLTQRRVRCADSIALAFILLILFVLPASAATSRRANSDIAGTVTDSASGQPLPSSEVSVLRGSEVVFNATTD